MIMRINYFIPHPTTTSLVSAKTPLMRGVLESLFLLPREIHALDACSLISSSFNIFNTTRTLKHFGTRRLHHPLSLFLESLTAWTHWVSGGFHNFIQ